MTSSFRYERGMILRTPANDQGVVAVPVHPVAGIPTSITVRPGDHAWPAVLVSIRDSNDLESVIRVFPDFPSA